MWVEKSVEQPSAYSEKACAAVTFKGGRPVVVGAAVVVVAADDEGGAVLDARAVVDGEGVVVGVPDAVVGGAAVVVTPAVEPAELLGCVEPAPDPEPFPHAETAITLLPRSNAPITL